MELPRIQSMLHYNRQYIRMTEIVILQCKQELKDNKDKFSKDDSVYKDLKFNKSVLSNLVKNQKLLKSELKKNKTKKPVKITTYHFSDGEWKETK